MMADARFYGCGVNHLRTSLHQQQFRVYTRQTVAASYRFAAGGGGRGVGGDRASARNSGTNNKHVGGRKLLSPPTTRGKKKHNGHASLHCYWAAPNGLNRCGYLQPGRSPPTKKKQTITISLFLRWTACNASILSRPFASAANKRIFHLCFKRINGPAPLDWIIVDQLRYIDEIPLPSLPLVHHISISIYIWEWRGTLQLRDLVGYKRTRRHFFPPFLPAIEGGNRAWFTTLHR